MLKHKRETVELVNLDTGEIMETTTREVLELLKDHRPFVKYTERDMDIGLQLHTRFRVLEEYNFMEIGPGENELFH